MKHISITVKGKVQGVWFRYFTQKEAEKHALSGFVKNTADGSVYIEASGQAKNIDDFIKWCWIGSPLSKVVDIFVDANRKEHSGPFRILR